MKFVIVLVAVLFAGNALAAVDINAAVAEAKQKKLFQERVWLGLLAYRGHDGNKHSEITSSEFFLDNSGAIDPERELVATLQALASPSQGDEAPICKFPARYRWLSQKLDSFEHKGFESQCPGLATWMGDNSDAVSLVFAAGFMSNPASFYGHMLLRFDSGATDWTNLEEHAVNFGAVIPDNEHMVLYIAKGLFGGYQAGFSTKEYYNFQHLYAETDLRDVWQYDLNLDSSQITMLKYHLWEVIGKKYDYYFLRENCALRFAYLLETLFDTSIIDQLQPYLLPSELLRLLARDGRYITKVSLTPSRQRAFYNKYHQLESEERAYLDTVVETGDFSTNLQSPQVAKTMDTAFDYYEYRSAKGKLAGVEDLKRKALLTRLKHQHNFSWDKPSAGAPHSGDNASMLRVSAIHGIRDYIGIKARPAYYDRLSNPASNIEFATLTMFELSLLGYDSKLRLDYLNFVDIVSLNAPQTPLAKDGGLAWRMKFSAGRFNNSCISCTSVNFTGGIGKAYQGQSFAVSALLNSSVFSDHEGSGILSLEPELSIMYRPKDRFRLAADISERFFAKTGRSHPVYRLESSLDLGPSWDIRLGFEKEVKDEFSVGVSYSW